MRIRQIKPSFWSDKVIASLPWRTRLVYVGLWQIADDGGWLPWDVAQVGAELLPYESVKLRERYLEEDMARLVEAGRVVAHDCGHYEIPTLGVHQHFGGRPVYTHRDAHARGCARMRADARNGRVGIGRVGKVSNGSEGVVENDATDFRSRMAALGVEP